MSADLSVREIKLMVKFAKTNKDYTWKATNSFLLTEQNQKVFIKYLNKLLNLDKQRRHVYEYINNVIFCISKDIIWDNIEFWLINVVNHRFCEMPAIWYTLIRNLIQFGKEKPSFNGLMITSELLTIISVCLVHLELNRAQGALSCLAVCLEEYCLICSALRARIELQLIECISLHTNNFTLVKTAAVCFSKLQKTEDPEPHTVNTLNTWGLSFQKLCFTLDSLYDKFLDGVNECCSYEKPDIEPYYQLMVEVPNDISFKETLCIIEKRLDNICVFLREMLDELYTPKVGDSWYTLDVIARILSLHVCITSVDKVLPFSTLLMKHQIAILYVLKSVINTYEFGIPSYPLGVEDLLLFCVTPRWDCVCGEHISRFRDIVYSTIEVLIKETKQFTHSNKLINFMLDDITPVSIHGLNIKGLNTLSNKTDKKLTLENIAGCAMKSTTRVEYNINTKERVYNGALSCLLTVVQYIPIVGQEDTLKKMYGILTQSLLSLQYNTPPTLLYKNETARMKMFEILIVLLECYKPHCASLLVELLTEGEKNSNPSIVHMCSKGLILVGLHLAADRNIGPDLATILSNMALEEKYKVEDETDSDEQQEDVTGAESRLK